MFINRQSAVKTLILMLVYARRDSVCGKSFQSELSLQESASYDISHD